MERKLQKLNKFNGKKNINFPGSYFQASFKQMRENIEETELNFLFKFYGAGSISYIILALIHLLRFSTNGSIRSFSATSILIKQDKVIVFH